MVLICVKANSNCTLKHFALVGQILVVWMQGNASPTKRLLGWNKQEHCCGNHRIFLIFVSRKFFFVCASTQQMLQVANFATLKQKLLDFFKNSPCTSWIQLRFKMVLPQHPLSLKCALWSLHDCKMFSNLHTLAVKQIALYPLFAWSSQTTLQAHWIKVSAALFPCLHQPQRPWPLEKSIL